MNKIHAALTALALVLAGATAAEAAGPPKVKPASVGPAGLSHPTIVVPPSSVEREEDRGKRAHTNVLILNPAADPQDGGPPAVGIAAETPGSLACLYGLVPRVPANCSPDLAITTAPVRTATKAIAIVDAYHNPKAFENLTAFSQQFGLPLPSSSNFKVVYASGVVPPVDLGWALESNLDLQYAHAMAPGATIILVEAASASIADLLKAEQVAADQLVALTGGGQISNSWAAGEFSLESFYESYFNRSGVVYFAASGDAPGVVWPSASPKVVSVGGTTVVRSTTGVGEVTWDQGGGGPSRFFSRPSYQSSVQSVVGKKRGTPDIALVANPTTGVWVYDSTYNPSAGVWWKVGGTSLSSPLAAGIVNQAGAVRGTFATSTSAELSMMYSNVAYSTASTSPTFTDVTSGRCGPTSSYAALTKYDFCTGVGTPFGLGGK
jgi:subtilase family serine protease